LPPSERFRVKGIAGALEVQKAGELHYRVLSRVYHESSVLREQLALLQVQLSRADPLYFYFKIRCFIDDDLPPMVTLVSLGQAVWTHQWRIQLDPEPGECFGLSAPDSATAVRLQFPLSVGDLSTKSSGTPNALLTMPGLELVPAGVDDVAAARETWERVRALYSTATENIAADRCSGLDGALAAYSLIGGYSGFYAAQEPDIRLPIPSAAKLPISPVNRNSFRVLCTDALDSEDDEPQVTVSASHAAKVAHEFRFPKRLLNQLTKSAKRAEQRRRQSAEFLRPECPVSFPADLATQAGVDPVAGNIPYSSSAADPVFVLQHPASSLADASFSPPAVAPLCQCCRLSLAAGGMSGANDLVSSVPVKEAQDLNREALSHSISRSMSAFVAQQHVQLRKLEEAAGVAIRNGTAVLLQKMPW
jgi:hypothetical protein